MATSLQQAADHLADALRRVREGSLDRVPSLRRLAHDAGVSLVTMWKALQRAKVEHGLDARPGRGIRFARREPDTGSVGGSHPGPKWQRCYHRLLADVNAGAHGSAGLLPGARQLSQQHGVSYRTMRKALEKLAADGVLEAARRGYELRARAGGSGNTVVLITRGGPGGIAPIVNRTYLHYRALESELGRRGLRLTLCAFDPQTRRFDVDGRWLRSIPSGAPWGRAMGFVLMEIPDEHLLQIAAMLKPAGLPVAVLDETTTGPDAPPSLDHPALRIVRIGSSSRSGRAMARYLLDLGHRRLAYLCPYYDAGWARNRFDGIVHECRLRGNAGVRLFAVEGYTELAQFSAEISGETNAVRRRVLALARGLTQVQREVLSSLAGPKLDEAAEYRRFCHVFAPQMARALADRQITAWIAASDLTAFAALDFLSDRGVSVPQRICVAGFDDRDEAFLRGLTSYNFGTTSIVNALVSHIIDPARRRLGPCVAEVDGFVVSRSSTAAVGRTARRRTCLDR
jgi:DNA-binding LacI/PurR family transcriptional regulator/DNA-binding transcriptional regulator YhcF (GntR family)